MDRSNRVIIDLVFTFLSLCSGAILEWQLIAISLFSYFTGQLVCRLILKGTNECLLYKILFISGYIFFLICAILMVSHGYSWFLSPDTLDFVNRIQPMVVEQGGNYFSILELLFDDYNFFKSEEYFFYSYSAFWGTLIYFLNGDFYICLQLSVIPVFALSGVLIYKILLLNNLPSEKGFKYTLIICLSSVLLFYSSQLLRDTHIMFLYLSSFYIILKSNKFSIYDLLLLVLIVYVTMGFRIESGLFLTTSIPLYLYVVLHKTKLKVFVLLISIPVVFVLLYYSNKYFTSLEEIYSFNREHYVDFVSKGSGVIGSLQRLPVIGDILSIFYNALLPIPCWSRLYPFGGKYGWEAYNIMNFPKSTAAFLNLITIVFILFWLFDKEVRNQTKGKISLGMKSLLLCGLLFLYLQSSVIDFRRLMGYYSLYYILFFVIRFNLGANTRNELTITAIVLFLVIQLLGLIYPGI